MKILTWQARNDKRISLVKLSQMTGISKSTLNNIENEKVSPTVAELETPIISGFADFQDFTH